MANRLTARASWPKGFLLGTGCLFAIGLALFASRVAFPSQALACVTNPGASNSHTSNGINHGWDRVWSCDHWVYHGWTDHGHGTKWVQVFNFSTNAGKCSDLESGSTNATCTATGSTNQIGTWNDTGSSANCDLFSDGHGICFHEMEPVL